MQVGDTIKTKVSTVPHPSVEVFIEGMGTHCTPDDSPIYLEFFEGKWQLVVWADINQEEPTHRIDMSSAFEANRLEK